MNTSKRAYRVEKYIILNDSYRLHKQLEHQNVLYPNHVVEETCPLSNRLLSTLSAWEAELVSLDLTTLC